MPHERENISYSSGSRSMVGQNAHLHGVDVSAGRARIVSACGPRHGAAHDHPHARSGFGLGPAQRFRVMNNRRPTAGRLAPDLSRPNGDRVLPGGTRIFAAFVPSEKFSVCCTTRAQGCAGDSAREIYDIFPICSNAQQIPGTRPFHGRGAADAGGGAYSCAPARDCAAWTSLRALPPVIVQQLGEVIRTLRSKV